MMYGVGLDSVEIERFAQWHARSYAQLIRIFSAEEITYALAVSPEKSAERFAVRFAAREALYKALHSLLPHVHIPLLTLARNVCVTHTANGAPSLRINWHALPLPISDTQAISAQVSLTHTSTIASAIVICWNDS